MRLLLLLSSFALVVSSSAAEPRLLVHYMPWFATKDVSGAWGWHWAMNHFDPDQRNWDDQREIASCDYPLIGPYDSGDDHALECQALLMKIAGHKDTTLHELDGFDHGMMPEPAFPLLVRFVEDRSEQ
jgi:hypothetical protein